jgi:hypothetical protein
VITRSPALATACLVLASVALAGCYGDVESFAHASAKQSCKRLRECDRSHFESEYRGDMGYCRDDVESDVLAAADSLEALGWEYDQDAGQACIETQRDLRNDCSSDASDAIADACNDVVSEGF